jgi:TetR/AcrR family transcriptional regulator
MEISETSAVVRLCDADENANNAERKRGRPRADTSASMDEAQLLRVAFSMFAAQGYEASTLRSMARELGVSHNLLNVRFGLKSELWKAAVDWRLAEAARDIEPAFTDNEVPTEQLRDLVHRFCRWAIINSDIVAISHQEGQQESWRLDYLIKQFILPFQKRLQRLLADVGSQRPLTLISSGALLALLVHGVGSFFALGPLQNKLLDDQSIIGGQEAQADAMAAFILAGLFALNNSS